jgi:hypothetical protein
LPNKKGANKMDSTDSHTKGYVLAAVLGAIGGGLVVALATNAVPRMMSLMMQNMRDHIGEAGFNPAEM